MGLSNMSNASLINGLQKLVDRYGAARVAVWLNYKDTRSIHVWLSTKNIPRARHELVRSVIQKQGEQKNG